MLTLAGSSVVIATTGFIFMSTMAAEVKDKKVLGFSVASKFFR